MELYLECMSCIMNNITSTAQRFISDKEKQYEVIETSLQSLLGYVHKESSAPILTEKYLEAIKKEVGIEDMYLDEKTLFNNEMMAIEDDFNQIIDKADNKIERALMLSGAANIIDFGLVQTLNKTFVKDKILKIIEGNSIRNETSTLIKDLQEASILMYVGDNCGEAVLDKLVLKNIKSAFPNLKIYYAVRSIPVLNDVTRKEAYAIGLDHYAEIIESGSTIPGTIVNYCSKDFKDLYNRADVRILKGMGNVETALKTESEAYFVFMVKCQFFSKKLKANLYDVMMVKGNPLYKDA